MKWNAIAIHSHSFEGMNIHLPLMPWCSPGQKIRFWPRTMFEISTGIVPVWYQKPTSKVIKKSAADLTWGSLALPQWSRCQCRGAGSCRRGDDRLDRDVCMRLPGYRSWVEHGRTAERRCPIYVKPRLPNPKVYYYHGLLLKWYPPAKQNSSPGAKDLGLIWNQHHFEGGPEGAGHWCCQGACSDTRGPCA